MLRSTPPCPLVEPSPWSTLKIQRFVPHMMLSYKIFLFCSLILLAASLALATESPWDGETGHVPRRGCLTDQEARAIVKTFESLSPKMNVTLAEMALAPDFHTYSYSVNRPGCQGKPVSPYTR